MNHMFLEPTTAWEEPNCIGNYTKGDPLCAKHCVVRLRCAIERDLKIRAEMIEELVASESEMGGRFQ